MASFIALSSSPDPLGTDFEPPGSMRPPPTQRTGPPATIARSNSRRQSGRISIPASSTQRSAWGTERQTFELDVSSGRSPQRLIVTVEAEEPSQRGAISRRLFGGDSSPTRSRSRRRDTLGGATTTMVPLRGLTDDEGGDLNTPRGRGRGRPLGTKNGTPAPRGTKRTGTPLLKDSRPARRRKNSEYGESMLSDAPLDIGTDGPEPQDPTPKPKPNARKNTPARKAGTTAVASSKPTGRKRGRPRKSVVPDEAAVVKDASKEPEPVLDTDLLLPSDDTPNQIPAQALHEQPRAGSAPLDDPMPSVSPAPEEDTPRNASRHRYSPGKSQSVDRIQPSPHESQDAAYDVPLSDVYMREPSSDMDSDAGAGAGPDPNLDTLARVSDFTMIALDTLPSFQKSFQASRSGLPQDPDPSAPEHAGDETNMMINQTRESWRSSAQGKMQPQAPPEDIAPTAGEASSPPAVESSPSSYAFSSPQIWSRSPRRPKAMPLSKRVFVNKAQMAEDSPSSKPGSSRKGTTPSNLPAKHSGAAAEDANPDSYEDSFSEIPDEVLAAATPKRPYRTARTSGTGAHGVQPYQQEAQVMNHAGFSLGLNKLPTPDDTNSSTTGSKNAQEDESRRKTGDATLTLNTSDLNIDSSPPAFHQRRTRGPEVEPAVEPGMGSEAGAGIEHEPAHAYSGSNHSESPSPLGSPSPQRPSAAVLDTKTQPAKGLEPSTTGRRPTLSPIVRVGRSLQNVMSDRSSPEGREGSLRSPFRGSASTDSRQSSIQKSPGTERREFVNQPGSRSFFNPLASLAQSIRSNFSQVSRHAPSSSSGEQAEGSLGPDSPERSSPLLSRGNPAGGSTEGAEHSLEPGQTTQPRSMISSVTVPPLSETATGDWTPMESSPSTRRTKRMAAPKPSGPVNSTNAGNRAHSSSTSRSVEPERVQAGQDHEQPLEYTKEPEARRNAPEEEQEFSDLDFEYVEVEEPTENGNWEHGEDQEIPATDLRQGGPSGRAEEIRPSLEDTDTQDVMINGQFDNGDDDMDIWDFEASRATPQSPQDARAGEETRRGSQSYMDGRSSQAPLQSSTNPGPARRGKASSPFRKLTRRLIYKDDFKSPSHIDLDESPPSEDNQELSAVPRTETHERPQETAPVRVEDVARTAQLEAREVAPDLPKRDGRPGDIRDEPPGYPHARRISDIWPAHAGERAKDIRDESRDRQFPQDFDGLPNYVDEQAEDFRDESPDYQFPEEIRDDTPERADERAEDIRGDSRDRQFPRDTGDDFLDYADEQAEDIRGKSPDRRISQNNRNDSPEHDLLLELGGSVLDAAPPAAANPPDKAPRQQARRQRRDEAAEERQMNSPEAPPTDYSLLLDQEQGTEVDHHPAVTTAESEDYSMLSRQKKNAEKKPAEEKAEKAQPKRSGLFGGFDIMSFFSSPAALPRDDGGPQSQSKTNAAPKFNPQPSRRGQPPSSDVLSLPEEPQSAPRATGLFPSIRPRSQQLSPERRADIFQPSSALRSADNAPDTDATSPATPGQQDFPSIPQKRNFTPLTGQTIRTASLFTPSVAPSTPARDEASDEATDEATDEAASDEDMAQLEQNRKHGHEAHEDGEDSIMTEESEYERYPPRASPSRWDRTLSPIKSSLRSPLKPKTPGKVVEFAEYASAPLALAQSSASVRQTSGMPDAAPNGVPGQRPSATDPKTAQDDKENGPSPPKDDFFTLPAAASFPGNAAVEPVKNGNLRLAPFEAGKGAGPKTTTTGATFAAPPVFSRSSLSKTTWSRAHWIRLDEFLQLRRHDPWAFQQQQQQRLTPHLLQDPDRRASPGRLRALVGKEVTAQGERVLLEPWHLEVVEAFRRDVGGWDEESLAKRLFALIVGEERRDAARAHRGSTHEIFA